MSGSRAAHRRDTRTRRHQGLAGLLALMLATALLALLPTTASAATGGEGMPSFTAVYDVQPDGSMKVTETITWRFPAGEERHGIFRNVVVRMGWNDEPDRFRYFDLTDVEVSSPSGAPDDFRVSDNGASREIRIGSPSEYTSGTQVYVLSYTLHDVLNPITADGKPATSTDQAATVELFYNVFGTNEFTERTAVRIEVKAPDASTKVACFQGPQGSTTECQAQGRGPLDLHRGQPGQRGRDDGARVLPGRGVRRRAARRARGQQHVKRRLCRGAGGQRGRLGRRHRRAHPRARRHGHPRVDPRS